jgi:hypothetical protein
MVRFAGILTIALSAMLASSINTEQLLHQVQMMFVHGLVVFPLFTHIWVMRVQRSAARLHTSANRLRIKATITPPTLSLIFQYHQSWWPLNTLFVFASATQLLALQRRIFLFSTLSLPQQTESYGLAWIALTLFLRGICRRYGRYIVITPFSVISGFRYWPSGSAVSFTVKRMPRGSDSTTGLPGLSWIRCAGTGKDFTTSPTRAPFT